MFDPSGGAVYGTLGASITLESATLQSNKQMRNPDRALSTKQGGGGLSIIGASAIIRQSTFIENEAENYGHQILSYSDSSLTIVNTQFTNIAGGNPIYGTADDCSTGPCTVAPFTGTCTDLSEGVSCGIIHTTCGNQVDGTTRLTGASSTTAGTCEDCDSGSFAASATENCIAHKTTCPDNEYLSGGSATADKVCLPHTTCGNQVDGTTTRLTGANGTEAGTCVDCDSGTFAANATDDCQAHKTTCPDNEHFVTDGTATKDHSCIPCAADEKSYGGAPCKKIVDCLSATEQGHRNIDVGYENGDYTVSMS